MSQDKHLLPATHQATGWPVAFPVDPNIAMIRGFVILLCLIGLPLCALPCSFVGLEHEIKFDPKSAALGTKNALALIDWFIKWRDGTGVGDVWISAYSVENNPRSSALSRERMHNIAEIIKPLNKNNVPVELYDDASVPMRAPLFVSSRVIVVVQPACVKTNTCCSQPIKRQDSP